LLDISKVDVTLPKGSRIDLMLEAIPGIAGVDEAGRGPLAGPVVAAAVILPATFDLTGLDDSKKLSPQKRDILADRIMKGAVWAIALCDHKEIDRENILNASMIAMSRAVSQLSEKPREVWVDGNRTPTGLAVPARCVVKGDGKIAAIAAASILAKTYRDQLMARFSEEFPEYGFDKNFGYPTPDHLEALRRFGPCAIHRRSFAPVAALVGKESALQPCLTFDD